MAMIARIIGLAKVRVKDNREERGAKGNGESGKGRQQQAAGSG
jgi:hypothetical protein